jgi:hypothetical protein
MKQGTFDFAESLTSDVVMVTKEDLQLELRRFVRSDLHGEFNNFIEKLHAELRSFKEDAPEQEVKTLAGSIQQDVYDRIRKEVKEGLREWLEQANQSSKSCNMPWALSCDTTKFERQNSPKSTQESSYSRPVIPKAASECATLINNSMQVSSSMHEAPPLPAVSNSEAFLAITPGDYTKNTDNLLQIPGRPESPETTRRLTYAKAQTDRDPREMERKSHLFAFSNVENIKEKVRANKLQSNPYNVQNFYHDTGIFQAIARHNYFENATLGVITLNALWISIDTDGNKADSLIDARAMYVVADCLFFSYFTFELFTRFMAFRNKLNCCRDAWFVFDASLVTLYLCDPFLLGLLVAISGGGGLNLPTAVLRLFRLARLSRLIRMVRSLPELMIMIKGMVSAAVSVGYTLGLLLVITYVFSIALRNLVPVDSNIEDVYFSSVPESIHNLIIYATFLDDLASFIKDVKTDSTACLILCWLYIALASLTVMNMLIGVLCEVISAVAEEEKEAIMIDKVKEKFSGLIRRLDQDSDGVVSWDEFQKILDFPEALQALESVNVDAEILVDMAEDFFFDEGEEPNTITFEQFMMLVLDVRGGQQATVKDVMGVSKRFSRKFLGLKGRLESMGRKIDAVDSKIDDVAKNFVKELRDALADLNPVESRSAMV